MPDTQSEHSHERDALVCIKSMPRISDNYLDCVIYLYRTSDDAQRGERVGGTGFIVRVNAVVEGASHHLYAVTNKHVIRKGQATVIRINTPDGGFHVMESASMDWVDHWAADDLSVLPLPHVTPNLYAYRSIPTQLFITKELLLTYNLGIGDDVFLVGRFINHEGKQRNLPAVRFGNIAMMPTEPIRNEEGLAQESFLVELRSQGGYSGAPVFVWRPAEGVNVSPTAGLFNQAVHGPWLLGVNWGHLPLDSPVREPDGTPVSEGWIVSGNTGMANVVPAWKLVELLDSKELVLQRQRIEAASERG